MASDLSASNLVTVTCVLHGNDGDFLIIALPEIVSESFR